MQKCRKEREGTEHQSLSSIKLLRIWISLTKLMIKPVWVFSHTFLFLFRLSSSRNLPTTSPLLPSRSALSPSPVISTSLSPSRTPALDTVDGFHIGVTGMDYISPNASINRRLTRGRQAALEEDATKVTLSYRLTFLNFYKK